ncbi:hypothetical protein AJ80_09135 [Polytolypa hystricis UAMH7299]|uniref:Major facilitator superfamily (MFS) profile domain-containing protein n=1 Tax=Polytolypa hystricis (strain UAMH7299) TaxID=1447883 RepID=A0A2B7WVW5_POLH7|nr:hypothetical protein AJ80_09135 [Polytolypa hystricis UAMH7299]
MVKPALIVTSVATVSPTDVEYSPSVYEGGELERQYVYGYYPESDQQHGRNAVDWDGPNDPENPYNWTVKKKFANIATLSVVTFLMPLGSSIFAPGIESVMKEFNSTNEPLSSFVVSVYFLAFAFCPLVFGPLSEVYGRMPFYHIANVLFVLANVACALASSLEWLIIFRLFAGGCGSVSLVLGCGTIPDMIRQEFRGRVSSAWAMGILLGPSVAPIIGGYLIQAKGWRWTFWLLAIVGGAVTLGTAIFMRESYHPVLLARKAERLRKETGNPNLRSVLEIDKSAKGLLIRSIIRPTRILFMSPIAFLLSIYIAIAYGYLYILYTTVPTLFRDTYNFSVGTVGVSYLGMGIGALLGAAFTGITSDRLLHRLSRKSGVMKPEYRLPPMFVGAFCIPIGLFWYGWSAEKEAHYMVPIVGSMWISFGIFTAFITIATYLVDTYTTYAASATAANSFLRSLGAALLPLCGPQMFKTLGLGWGSSMLAFIAIAMIPFPFILYRYGEQIRKSPRWDIKL